MTQGVPQADGSFQLTGSKIFISAGEHDLAANIIHLVLARLPDAPPGTKGISLFVVPKFLPDTDGKPGARNPIFCGAIEEKMGIHGNATCQINLEQLNLLVIRKQKVNQRLSIFSLMVPPFLPLKPAMKLK